MTGENSATRRRVTPAADRSFQPSATNLWLAQRFPRIEYQDLSSSRVDETTRTHAHRRGRVLNHRSSVCA